MIYFAFASFGPLQIRLVDAFLPLAVLFGPPAIVGVTIGCFVGNLLGSPFGIVDILGGPVANLVAATLAWAVTRRRFPGSWILAVALEIAVISVIVGTYLVALGAAPGVPAWLGWIEFLGSEVVAIGILGYPLLKGVARAIQRNPISGSQNPS